MVGLAWFPTFDLALTVCEPQLLSKVTHSWGATESELEVIPPPSSRPFPQSCLPTQMPLPCSLFLQLPSSSLPCISSLISCAGNPQPPPHPPQLSRQVAQEKTAMGKDSQAHWRGYLPGDPFIWSCPQKRKWVDLHFPTEACRVAEECFSLPSTVFSGLPWGLLWGWSNSENTCMLPI